MAGGVHPHRDHLARGGAGIAGVGKVLAQRVAAGLLAVSEAGDAAGEAGSAVALVVEVGVLDHVVGLPRRALVQSLVEAQPAHVTLAAFDVDEAACGGLGQGDLLGGLRREIGVVTGGRTRSGRRDKRHRRQTDGQSGDAAACLALGELFRLIMKLRRMTTAKETDALQTGKPIAAPSLLSGRNAPFP